MWYMTETTNTNSVGTPEQLNAKSLRGAKIAAGNKQSFLGTVLSVGQTLDSSGFLRAEWKRVDGVWYPVDPYDEEYDDEGEQDY